MQRKAGQESDAALIRTRLCLPGRLPRRRSCGEHVAMTAWLQPSLLDENDGKRGQRLPPAPDMVSLVAVRDWRAGKAAATIIRRKVFKRFILALANKMRFHKFSRVDEAVFYEADLRVRRAVLEMPEDATLAALRDAANGAALRACHAVIQRAPSMGKTLR